MTDKKKPAGIKHHAPNRVERLGGHAKDYCLSISEIRAKNTRRIAHASSGAAGLMTVTQSILPCKSRPFSNIFWNILETPVEVSCTFPEKRRSPAGLLPLKSRAIVHRENRFLTCLNCLCNLCVTVSLHELLVIRCGKRFAGVCLAWLT